MLDVALSWVLLKDVPYTIELGVAHVTIGVALLMVRLPTVLTE